MGINKTKDRDSQIKEKILELFKAINYSIDHMSRLNFTPGNNKLLGDSKASSKFIVTEKVPVVIKS